MIKFAFSIVVILCFALVQAPAAQSTDITVSPNVQVSRQNASLFHGEVLIGADPVNARHLVACSGLFPRESDRQSVPVIYSTFDGGLSWKTTTEPPNRHDGLDPVCDVGFGGAAYFGWYGSPNTYWWQRLPGADYLAYSRDGGLTWLGTHAFPPGDRDFLTIDKTHSRYRGRVYYTALSAERHKRSFISERYSTDNGTTFSRVVTVFKGKTPADDLGSSPGVVLSNGTFILFAYAWPSTPTSPINAFVSTDGGGSFSKPHPVAKRINSESAVVTGGYSPVLVAAADTTSGPFHNRVYLAWEDYRFGHGDIVMSHSEDAGTTWSPPVLVDDARLSPSGKGPDATNAAMSVNKNGVVGILWYDQRDIHDNIGARMRFAASSDGGDTFSSSVAVASSPSLVSLPQNQQPMSTAYSPYGSDYATIGVWLRYHIFGGDTSGLTADANGIFHPLWIDNRTGISQVWTSRVSVSATAIRNGSRELQSLTDLTKTITLRFTDPIYDHAAQTASVNLSIVNTSNRPIVHSLYLRILGLSPVLGDTTILGADNGIDGPGAILKFALPAGTNNLKLGERTIVRRVRFHLSSIGAFTEDSATSMVPFVSFRFRVLGTKKQAR